MAGKGSSLHCKMCKKLIILRSSKVLQCNECKHHFHRDCINVTVKEIAKNVNFKWFCEICKEIVNVAPQTLSINVTSSQTSTNISMEHLYKKLSEI